MMMFSLNSAWAGEGSGGSVDQETCPGAMSEYYKFAIPKMTSLGYQLSNILKIREGSISSQERPEVFLSENATLRKFVDLLTHHYSALLYVQPDKLNFGSLGKYFLRKNLKEKELEKLCDGTFELYDDRIWPLTSTEEVSVSSELRSISNLLMNIKESIYPALGIEDLYVRPSIKKYPSYSLKWSIDRFVEELEEIERLTGILSRSYK